MKSALRERLMNLLIKDGVAPVNAQALLNQLAEPVGLRDTFAAAAMQGMCAIPSIGEVRNWTSEGIASSAYSLADAMIEARKTK